ncbi:cral trio domain containing protein [Nannochloropsis oceanica]
MAVRRGDFRRMLSAATVTFIFAAALLPLAALGFMLPLQHRLREPNDVHHSFRETAPAMRQGPNLLLVGPLPACPPAGDGGFVLELPPGLAELQQQQQNEEVCPSPYSSTAFEDLFSLDKSMDISSLLEPLEHKQVAFNDAFPPSFVPLTDLFDQGLAATKEAVAVVKATAVAEAQILDKGEIEKALRVVACLLVRKGKAAGAALGRSYKKAQGTVKNYVSENTRLLQRSIVHLVAEAREVAKRTKRAATLQLDGLLMRLESSLPSHARGKIDDMKEIFRNNYTLLQLAARERRAVIQALLSAHLTAVNAGLATLNEKVQAYYLLLQETAAQKQKLLQAFIHSKTTTTTQDGEITLNGYGRAMLKAEEMARGSFRRGYQLASRIKARQVERWVLGGERGKGGGVREKGVNKNMSDLASDFGMRIMKAEKALTLPASLSSSSSSSVSVVPAFSTICGVSGGGREGGRVGEEGMSLVPYLDDEPWQRDEVKEDGREVQDQEGGVVGDEVEMTLTDETEMVIEEPVEAEGREEADVQFSSSSSCSSSNNSIIENSNVDMEGTKEDEDEDEDEDDHHDGLGLIPPTHAQVESEDEYLQDENLPSSASLFSSSSLALPPSLLLTPTEQSRLEKLHHRLIMLPDSLTHWVAPGDLVRFIRTHDHLENAWSALKKTCYFRRDQGVDLLLSPGLKAHFEHSEMSKELFWFGRDREGDPVLVFRTALHRPGRHSSEEYLKYMLFLMEMGRVEYGLGQTTQVSFLVDRQDGGLRNQDPGVVLALVPLLQAHFPDMLKKTYIAPVNGVFQFIWRIFTMVLAKETAGRVQLLSRGEIGREGGVLREVFFEEQLMTYLGGTLEAYEDGVDGEEEREGGRGRGNGSMASVLSSA